MRSEWHQMRWDLFRYNKTYLPHSFIERKEWKREREREREGESERERERERVSMCVSVEKNCVLLKGQTCGRYRGLFLMSLSLSS